MTEIQDAVVVEEQEPGTEIAPVQRILPNSFTGEVIDLDAPTEQLAHQLRKLRDLDEERMELVKAVSAELTARMDRDAKWTIHFPGLDITGQAPGRRVYKTDRLVAVLRDLVEEDKITKDAARAAVERTVSVSYKKKQVGINALLKLGGEVARRIKSAEVPLPDSGRSVSVKAKDAIDA